MSTPINILLVEDDEIDIMNVKKAFLKLHMSNPIYIAVDGEQALQMLAENAVPYPRVILLDLNMPKMNGFTLAKNIRERNEVIPILFLTANSSQEDKIKGFDYGADEYMTKPFDLEELVARMKAILKRSQYAPKQMVTAEEKFEIGNMVLDFTNHQFSINGENKRISTTEAQLLKLFITNKNSLLTRNAILLNVWGRDDYYTARNLDVYINKLRKLIKPDEHVEIINIHGSGFKLVQTNSTP
ncbi:MAG: DNA-binding response regulator [Bacteroidetes bacterium]|nr:MAG: DNA-binding response regulator [Bacteroidota bacterium]